MARIHVPDAIFNKLALHVGTRGDKKIETLHKILVKNNYPMKLASVNNKVDSRPSGVTYDNDGVITVDGEVVDNETFLKRMALPKENPQSIDKNRVGINLSLILAGEDGPTKGLPLKFVDLGQSTSKTGKVDQMKSLSLSDFDELGIDLDIEDTETEAAA